MKDEIKSVGGGLGGAGGQERGAAGKGGRIKRVTETLDPRGFNVNTFAAPSGEEGRHHYLWRF